MRAAVVDRPQGPDSLQLRDVPRPTARPGWVLVKVEAFGLNRSEYFTLRGDSGAAVSFPRIPGIECVGVVEEAVDSRFEPGAVVAAAMGGMGRKYDGSYAEYALLPERQLMPVQTALPWDVLGALPETFLTAQLSLDTLSLEPGQTLLVRGGTSSVGLACLGLARAAGVRVISTTRSDAKAAALRDRGADDVVLEGDGLAERVRTAVHGAPDAVVDLIGARALLDSLAIVKRGGTVCNSGQLGGVWVIEDFQPMTMIPPGRKLTAYTSEELDGEIGTPALQAIVDAVEKGHVDPNIDRVYSLEDIADAHRRMAANEATGKLVVVP